MFLFGGSARADSLGQLVVIPVSFAMLLVGAWRFAGAFSTFRAAAVFLVAACAVVLLQLIPLPPSAWSSLPGHAQFDELTRLTGTQEQWRPINLVPQLGWISLAALLTPAAVFALACGMTTSGPPAPRLQRTRSVAPGLAQANGFERLLILVVLIGMASAMIAIAQVLGPPGGPLYLHRITNEGAAVGLFANRNHQAAFLTCLLPLLATWASMPSRSARGIAARRAALVGTAGLIIALTMVGGSRAGIVLAAIGLGWSFAIYRPVETHRIRGEQKGLTRLNRVFAVAVILGMVLLTIILSRAQSIERAMEGGDGDVSLRTDFWLVAWHQAWEFFPFGTGLGSFVESYRMVEPLELLTPYYVNHAHNDWLEVLHGGGLPAAALLIGFAIWWLVRMVALFRSGARQTAAGRLALAGGAVISILGVASVVDYPLRTAPLSALFMLAAVWLGGESGSRGLPSK